MHAIGSMLRRLTGGDEARGHLTGGGPTSPHLTESGPASAIAAADATGAAGATGTTGAADAAGTHTARTARTARAVPELIESDAVRWPPSEAGLHYPSAVGRPTPLSSAAGRPSPSAAAAGLRSCLFCHPMPTLKIDRDTVLTAGISNTADFAHQIHVAFSALVSNLVT